MSGALGYYLGSQFKMSQSQIVFFILLFQRSYSLLREQVIMTINSGLALATTQAEVKKIYNDAGIDYYLPQALLQLPSK